MKFIKLLVFATLFCACATPALQQSSGREPVRNYPVFLQDGRTAAAFKFDIKVPSRQFSTVLAINKINDTDFKIKILAEFGTIVLDSTFNGSSFTYNYVLGNMFDKKAISAFEDLIAVLLLPPSDFIRSSTTQEGELQLNFRTPKYMNRYHFRRGISFPYKMEQIKRTVRKKFTFNNYDIHDNLSLPTIIICEDAHNITGLTLTLISVK